MNVPNLLTPLSDPLLIKWRSLLNVFQNEREQPYGDILTPTQIQIIDIIAKRRYPRTQLILPTQYGKSLAVSLGVLLRAAHHHERWAIVAPSEDKARIIMDYIIDHIFDDVIFSEQLEYYGSKERLKQEKSKLRITFRDGGEVRVYTGNASNSKSTKKALMGFGSPNIILDESSLIDDDLYSTVKRMLGGSSHDSFLLEIGNPFFRNHFYRTWHSSRYKKIFADVHTALAEDRYSQDFVDEMREEAFFEVLYECLFPDSEEVRSDGYRRLLADATIENAYIDAEAPIDPEDRAVLGVDVAAGGENQTVFVLRYPKSGWSKVLEKNNDDDLDDQADRVMMYRRQYDIGDYRIMIDDGGVGHGLGDILKNKHDLLFKPVLAGSSAEESKRYSNKKAELNWRARKWLKADNGKLLRDQGFEEAKIVYYKQNTSDKLQIESKEKLRKRGIVSPDTWDAFVLTFETTSGIVEDDDIIVD